MGEIRFVGTGEIHGYPYLVCKKHIFGIGHMNKMAAMPIYGQDLINLL